MSYVAIKSFGKRQKSVLAFIYQKQLIVIDNPVLNVVVTALASKDVVQL